MADELIAYSDKPETVRDIADQLRDLAEKIDETTEPHFRQHDRKH